MPKLSERSLRAILSSAILVLPVFLLVPTFIFLNNPHEASLEYGNLLLIAAVLTLAAVAMVAPICHLARGFVASGLGIAIAAKLYFLPSFVPILDGDEVFAKFKSFQGIWSVVTLVVLIIAGLCVARRLSTTALAFIAGAFVIMGLQPLLAAKNWTFDWPSLGTSYEPESTEAKLLEFSRDGDVLVILLDTVQTDVFAEILEENPEYRASLTGFTYFWNTIGSAPTTLMSMVAIYSGTPYQGGSVSARYADLRNASIYSDFEKSGYETILAGASIYDCPAMSCTVPTKLNLVGELEADLSGYLEFLEPGLMRVLPTFAHTAWYNRGDGRLRAFLPNVPINRAQQHLRMLDVMASDLSISDHPARFKMLHLLGTHHPINLDANCIATKNPKGKPRAAYKDQVVCNLKSVANLIEALKRAGIYDRTTIVLIADHGNNSGEPAKALEPFLGSVPPLWGRRARFDPLLAIKLPGDNQPFRLSAAPAQISDLRATLCAEVLKCEYEVAGENVFRLAEDASRKRCFMDFYLWQIDHRILDGMPEEAYQVFCTYDLLSNADYDPSGIPPRTKFR